MDLSFIKSFDKYITYIIPVVGVLFFGWSVFAVLLFFCIENLLQGIFFFLRGSVSVFYGGGIGFLIVFSFLYFAHVISTAEMMYFLSQFLGIISIPPLYVIITNLVIMVIPHIYKLFDFAVSLKKITPIASQSGVPKAIIETELKKEDMTPVVDLLIGTKEMFYHIGALWATMLFAVPIVLLKFIHTPTIITSVLLIAVFSFFHYYFDKYALIERQKLMGGYLSWKNGAPTA